MEWYLSFLIGELIPTASYQRHITSLKALSIYLDAGCKAKHRNVDISEFSPSKTFEPATVRLLLDMLLDPFEDVRGLAAAILKMAPSDTYVLGSKVDVAAKHNSNASAIDLEQFLSRAEDASKRTGRADLADGVARIHELRYNVADNVEKCSMLERLVSDLERSVLIAEGNLATAVLDAPIHGRFASLR